MNLKKCLGLALVSVAAACAGTITIDYRFATGTDVTTSSFDFDGVDVTGGPRQILVNVSNGLSILGGVNDFAVDPGEFLTFTFDGGPTVGITAQVNNALTSTATLEAFGAGGGSLGQQTVSLIIGTPIDVSGLYGNQPIKDFTLTGVSGSYRFDMDAVARGYGSSRRLAASSTPASLVEITNPQADGAARRRKITPNSRRLVHRADLASLSPAE